MTKKMIESLDVLQNLAFEEIAGRAANHGLYRLAMIEKGSWQADVLCQSSDVMQVKTTDALRSAMRSPEVVFIYVPDDSALTQDAVMRIMSDTSLKKTVIFELSKTTPPVY